MANELETLQQQIADARKELADLDSLRIERDHIITSSAAEQKKLDGLKSDVAAEEENLAGAKSARADFEAEKNETLLKKEMDLNGRSADLDLREKKVSDGERDLDANRSLHQSEKDGLLTSIRNHGANAEALSKRSIELDGRERGLNERENAIGETEKGLNDRKQAVEARETAASAQEGAAADRTASLDKRESDLGVREKNVELLEKSAQDAKAAAQADQLSAKQVADQNDQERTRLMGVGADMVSEKSALDTRTAQVESRESAANSKEIELRAREKRVSQQEKDLALEKEING